MSNKNISPIINEINKITNNAISVQSIGKNLVLLDPAGAISNNSVNQEDLIMYASLSATVRPKTLIQNKPDQKILEVTFVKEGSTDLNTASPVGKTFLTTDWTNISSFDSQVGKDLETFGMTSIDMSFNSGFIPQVTINFVDVRGATLFEQGSCSPYGAFFHQPWPIFELTVKGYYGNPVKYSLALKNFTTKFNPSNGNYESTAEFIGYSYAFLSDILIGYALAAPYMEGSEEKLKNIYQKYLDYYTERQFNNGKNAFSPINSETGKPITLKNYLDAVQKLQSGQDGQDPAVIGQIRGSQELKTLTDSEKLQSTLDELNGLISDFGNEWKSAKGNYDSNTNKLTSTQDSEELKAVYEANFVSIGNTVEAYNSLISEDSLGEDLKLGNQNLPANNFVNNSSGIQIDLNPLQKDIEVKKQNFKTKINSLKKSFTDAANELIKKELGFVPTVRSFFTVLLANTELFLELLKEASADAEQYHSENGTGSKDTIRYNNQSNTPINKIFYAWPTYVDDENQKHIEKYPGINKSFRRWPEVTFTDNFIKALKQMIKDIEDPNGIQNDFLEYEGKPGYDNYLPLNAMESPAGEPTSNIAYFNNTKQSEVYKNIGERFIVHNNMSAINLRYLYSSSILKSYRKYKELDDVGFFPVSFTNLDNIINENYSFGPQYPKTNWGRVEGYNFFYTVQNDDMFNVIKTESKDLGVAGVTNKVLEALGLKNDGSEYYFYDKDILLNPKEGVKRVKPDIHEVDGDSLVTFLPCENCTGAIQQGTDGAIVDFNEVLRNPVTNSRALLLKNDNLIINYPNEAGSKSLSLIEELTKGTGFNPKTGLNDREGITRIVDLNEVSSIGSFKYKTDDKWWRYNGLRLKKSTPWLTYSSSIGDLSVTSFKQWAKISNFSQVNNVILDTMSTAQIYPDYTLNYQVGFQNIYKTKDANTSNYGDFSYAYTDDIGELTHNIGNNEEDYGTKVSTILDSGWYTMLPSYSYSDGDRYVYNYSKNKAYIYTGNDNFKYPQEQWKLKQVYYSPAATDTIYDKSTILDYFKKSKTTNNDYNNQLQKGKYNKNWVNQGNLIIDTPFWKHNFPSGESNSTSTESHSYTMFGSSVLAEVKFSDTGNKIELSKDGFYMGVKLDLSKGLGTYIGFAPAINRVGVNASTQISQSDRIDMLTTHNQDVFNIYAIENKESKSQITNPSNLNRTEAWKGSLAYLFLANQLHRPWTGMYTNSNKYLGPQSILGSGSMSAIIPKHSVYLLGAVLWRMRESGLFISDDKKWNIEPQQSYINGKYVDPLNVPLLPKELVFKRSTKSWSFNTSVLAIPNGSTTPTPPITVSNGPYSFESDTISFTDGPWNQLSLIKVGNTVKIITPQPNSLTFTYKCGSNSNKFNFSVHSVTPKNSLLTYVKNTMCKKPNETDFDKVIIDDIQNDTYNSNWGVRPPMASLLINSNSFNRKNDQLGVICFPRADEWPAPNLGMVYALDLEDEVYGDSGNVVNPFKNQYKIFTPIFGRKSGLTLRMSNNNARFLANKDSEESYINLLKQIANTEATKINDFASNTGNILLRLSTPSEEVILEKIKNTSSLSFNSIDDILKSEKNYSAADESYTKLSFIYHDIQSLGAKTNLNEENGRSIRGKYYPGTHSETQLQKIKDKEKDTKDTIYKLQNTNFSQNIGGTSSFNILPEIKYNNDVLNTVKKSNTTNEDKYKKENLYEDEARGYLRGYIPIGPEIWFMPTAVKEKFISLFEDFVGDFNNFNDSSDFDFVLKTIDPLNFPRPDTNREKTPNQTPINGIKQGLPDDLVYSNFFSIQGTTTEAPTVSVENLQVDTGFTGNVAAEGKTYYTKYEWHLERLEGVKVQQTVKKNTKFTKNGNKIIFKADRKILGAVENAGKIVTENWYFSCNDRLFRKSGDTKTWSSTNPQKTLETELGKQFCGDPTKVIDSGITTTFINSEPHPSVKKWLNTYGLAERVKSVAIKALGIQNGQADAVTSKYNVLNLNNQDVQQVHKMLFQDGYVLSSLSPRIWWGEIKIDDKSGTRSKFNNFRIKKTELDEFITGFVEIITSKQIEDTQIEKIKKEILGDDNYSSDEDDDIRLSTYKAFKAIYDKWISASKVNSGTEKGELFYNAIGEDGRLLIDHFSFVNRVNADIGDKAIINVNQLGNLLHNYTMSMYGAIDDVLSQSNFNFHALPGYVDLTLGLTKQGQKMDTAVKASALANMFLPQPHSSIFEQVLSGPHFLCMYIGGLSQKLDLQNAPNRMGCVDEQNKPESAKLEQKGDSFLFTDTTIPEDYTTDEDSPGVVAFKVAFASQNQSHFTSVELDQSEYKNTQESLLAIEKIAQAASPDSTGGFVTKGQSMYDIYLNRSYSCTVEALGNMMIQPLQYFQLENVPMFYGSYLIRDVKHSITPNNVRTTFTGDRIPQAVVPIVEDVVAAFNLSPADKVSGNLGTGNNPGDFTSTDRITKGVAIVNRLMNDLTLTKEQAAGVVGNLIKESGLIPDIIQPNPPLTRGPVPLPINDLGYGWAQWGGNRKQSFIDFAKKQNIDITKTPATDEINYQWLVEEMSTFYVKNFLQNLKSKKTVQDASIYFAKIYEGCAACTKTTEQQERIGYANQVMDAIQTGVSDYGTVSKNGPIQSGPVSIYNGGKIRKSVDEFKPHHDCKKTRTFGSRTVCYRKSGWTTLFKSYLDANDWQKFENDAKELNHIVYDLTILQNGKSQAVGIYAPFNCKVVNAFGNPNSGIILVGTGVDKGKTAIFLHVVPKSQNTNTSNSFSKDYAEQLKSETVGKTYQKGAFITFQGNWGDGSTGVHLHIEAMLKEDFDKYITNLPTYYKS